MPTAYIKKLTKKRGESTKSLEKKWNVAKEKAAEGGHSEEYDVITGLFKKMIGESYDAIFKD